MPPDAPSLLIAAVSGRALAEAARRAGFVPLVADFFADRDTRAVAHGCRELADLKRGMRWEHLEPALDALARAAPSPVLGVICGAGLEDRPELLAALAARWPLLGNGAETVARVKAPEEFFATLDRLGIAHPATTMARPANGADWLAKRRGGAGGGHVTRAPSTRGDAGVYFQHRVEGRSVSALFVGNGRAARVLGFSEQWTAPSRRSAWRYGGAVQPADLGDDTQARMTRAVEGVVAAFGLEGLGSADFMLGADGPLLLEINPRPGATLDIFDSAEAPLLRLHLDAVTAGKLPAAPARFTDAAASAIVHAPERLRVPQALVWPDWARDIPDAAQLIDKDRPICTVLARAATKDGARRLAKDRVSEILAVLRPFMRGKTGGQIFEPKRKAERHASS